jgi:hypothetical protein
MTNPVLNSITSLFAIPVAIALASCASVSKTPARSPAKAICDAPCRAAQAVAIEALGYIAKGVYLTNREKLLEVKRNPTPAAPFRPHTRSGILGTQAFLAVIETLAGFALIDASAVSRSGVSANAQIREFFHEAIRRQSGMAASSVIAVNAATAFSIDVPTEATKTVFNDDPEHYSGTASAGASENWQFVIRRSAREEAAVAEAHAVDVKREMEITAALKSFADDTSKRIGRVLALSQTEVLAVKRQLETRLLKRFDPSRSDIPVTAPIDLVVLLTDSGIDFARRTSALAEVLNAVDGRYRTELDYPTFYEDLLSQMNTLIAWNVAQSERLRNSKNPRDREIRGEYLKNSRKLEFFAERLAAQRDLLKEEK